MLNEAFFSNISPKSDHECSSIPLLLLDKSFDGAKWRLYRRAISSYGEIADLEIIQTKRIRESGYLYDSS